MNRRMLKCLAALAALLLVMALGLGALAEAPDTGEALALEEEIVFGDQVDPEAALAEDAGDTGLTVEYEDAPQAELAEDEIELPTGDEAEPAGEAWEEPEDAFEEDEYGDTEILALGEASTGYVAVAANAPIFSDADLTRPLGVFPEGATAYAEAVMGGGAVLRIRFDTQEARDWAREILTGYVSVSDTLHYTDAEAEALKERLAADVHTRRVGSVAIPCAATAELETAVLAEAGAVGLGVAAHTPAEIQAFVNAHPSYRNQINIYSLADTEKPYATGRLSKVNQTSALNLINQVRYIAGVDANMTLFSEKEEMMAASSLVNRLNGGLSHYPVRPAVLADGAYDALYNLGYAGSGSANIAMGYSATGSILAYMADSDDNNLSKVGHRRWIINPKMGRTVMGASGRFSAMYAHDMTGSGWQTKAAWPAQEMPVQYFAANVPWSVSYGRKLEAGKVTVDLVRVSDGRTWHFSQAGSDGDFFVENSYYAEPGCVIFRPSGLGEIAVDERFNVSITDGATGEVTRYTVHFFSLDLSAATPMDALTVSAVRLAEGNRLSWNADARAKGYYVCRRDGTAGYQIVADVTGTEYLDTTIVDDVEYYYQVYAHTDSVTSRAAISVRPEIPKPESVALNHTGTVSLYTNMNLQLTAGFEPSYAQAELTWKTSNKKVAKVSSTGLVTPVKKGSAIITVTTDNGKSASVKVQFSNPPKPKKVTLDHTGTVTLNVGETLQLNATVQPADASTKLKWKSSSSSKAKVSSTGLVTARKAGTTTIRVTTSNGKSAKVKVKVVDPRIPTKVVLDHTGTVTLKVGETLQLGATVLPDTAQTKLTWKTSKKKVASVSGSGAVTALRKGTATITVKTSNGKKATVKIKVVP